MYNVIIACDGLWDYVEMEPINDVVKNGRNHSGTIARELKNLAKEYASKDNISVMSV
jgi:serine/threonine protein phosphatase PrpC